MFPAEQIKNECVAWIRDFFEKNGKDCNAVVGISGGKDSSVAAALCVEALGKDRVIGVLMPCGKQPDIDMAKHTFSAYFVIWLNRFFVCKAADLVHNLTENFRLQSAIRAPDDTVCTRGVKARASSAVLILANGVLGFISVSRQLSCALCGVYGYVVKSDAVEGIDYALAFQLKLIVVANISVHATAAAYGCCTKILIGTARRRLTELLASSDKVCFGRFYYFTLDNVPRYRPFYKDNGAAMAADAVSEIVHINDRKGNYPILFKLRHRILFRPQV